MQLLYLSTANVAELFSLYFPQATVTGVIFSVPAWRPQNNATLKISAFEWFRMRIHHKIISILPPTIYNSALHRVFVRLKYSHLSTTAIS